MSKSTRRFQTSVLFEMATGKYNETTAATTLAPVISHIFPGIDYWERQQKQIIKDRVAPELVKQHPHLKTFNSVAEAVKALGDSLPVAKVEKCRGFEWMIPKAA